MAVYGQRRTLPAAEPERGGGGRHAGVQAGQRGDGQRTEADGELLGVAGQLVVGGGGHDAGEADVQPVGSEGRETQGAAGRDR